MLNTTDGSFVYTPTAGYVGSGQLHVHADECREPQHRHGERERDRRDRHRPDHHRPHRQRERQQGHAEYATTLNLGGRLTLTTTATL